MKIEKLRSKDTSRFSKSPSAAGHALLTQIIIRGMHFRITYKNQISYSKIFLVFTRGIEFPMNSAISLSMFSSQASCQIICAIYSSCYAIIISKYLLFSYQISIHIVFFVFFFSKVNMDQ